MAADSLRAGLFNETQLKNKNFCRSFSNYNSRARTAANNFNSRACRASQEPLSDSKNKFYKELGLLFFFFFFSSLHLLWTFNYQILCFCCYYFSRIIKNNWTSFSDNFIVFAQRWCGS